MRVEFAEAAREEAAEVQAHYAAAAAGLGEAFAQEIRIAIEKIQEAPLLWSPITRRTRRFVIHRFPYIVVYRVSGDLIRIVAVAHQRRRSGYWQGR